MTVASPDAVGRSAAPRAAPRMMFDRLEKTAVRSLMEAQKEAKRMGASEVTASHVLIGIASQKDATANALQAAGVTAVKVRDTLNKQGDGDTQDIGRVARLFQLQTNDTPLPFSSETEALLQASLAAANPAGDMEVGGGSGSVSTTNVLEGLVASDDNSAVRLMRDDLDVDVTALRRALAEGLVTPELVGAGADKMQTSNSTLAQCGVDLTKQARDGELDPVYGRDEEIERMMQTLVRRRKNNPCLVGDPGVGKTALAEGLALRIAEGSVPPKLKNKRIFSLELGLLVADTKYRGEFEERLRNVLDELDNSTIVFIDEIHTLIGAGSAEGGIDAANLLKPALARGKLQCIGATTLAEYRKHIEKDAALERRFQPLLVDEPTVLQTQDILRALAPTYADHHGLAGYTDDALEAAARLSDRYIADRFLPDKAIDLVDEAGALVQLAEARREAERAEERLNAVASGSDASTQPQAQAEKPFVTPDEIARVVSRWTGIPVDRLSQAEADQLLSLEETLHRRVVGQKPAVSALARAIRRARVGLRSPRRPVASFVFSGPTGVGKTELAKAVAEYYYGSEKSMVRLDMSEYMEAHTVARLVGPPPGYIGYDEGGQLTEAVRRRPHSVVLLDEIEKAHPDVFNALLQVLEDGRLTDGKGRTIDFSNTLLILTSNVGSQAILESLSEDWSGGGGVAKTDLDEGVTVRINGQAGKSDDPEPAPRGELSDYERISQVVKDEMSTRFRPEFLNRLDQIIVFHPLTRGDVAHISELMLNDVFNRTSAQGVTVELTPAMKAQLVDEGFDSQYGARPLRRAVQRLVEDVAAECMLDGFAEEGSCLTVDTCGEDGVRCSNGAEERDIYVASSQGIERSRSQSLPVATSGDAASGASSEEQAAQPQTKAQGPR